MRTHLLAATFALCSLPALGAEQPPEHWVLADTWPAAGAVGAPTDGVLVVRGAPAYAGAGASLAAVIEVAVWVDGQRVPGHHLPARLADEALWRADAPFPPSADIEVELSLHNDGGAPEGGEVHRTYRFTTGARQAGAVEAPEVVALTGTVRTLEGDKQHLVVEAEVGGFTSPFAGFDLVCLQLSPGAEPVKASPLYNCYDWRVGGPGAIEVDLGRLADWSSEQVCASVYSLDPLRRERPSALRCVALKRPEEGAAPSAEGPAPAAGCSVSRGGRAPGLLGLFLLLSLRRRRRHIA